MNIKKFYSRKFLILAIGLYIVFFIGPAFAGMGYSLTDWNQYKSGMNFVGLENFKKIIFEERQLLNFIGNTFKFATFTASFKIIVGLSLALLLNTGIKGKSVLRTIFYMPTAVSPLIIGILFSAILAPNGVINELLRWIGLGGLAKSWLSSPVSAMNSVISVEIWRQTGFNMIIFLAGLQTIPKELYEAARIDGGNTFQVFRNITLPFLVSAITINLILNVINGLKVFDIVFALTSGGPANTTQVLNTAIFREYGLGRLSMASALGVVMFFFTTVIALSILKYMSGKEFDR